MTVAIPSPLSYHRNRFSIDMQLPQGPLLRDNVSMKRLAAMLSYSRFAWNYLRTYGTRQFIMAVGRKSWRVANNYFMASKDSGVGIGRIEEFFDRPGVNRSPTRPAGVLMRSPRVSIIGDLNLPQCRKYRVMQKLESFVHMGVSCDYSSSADLDRGLYIIQLSTLVIFYRMRSDTVFHILREECERLQVPYLYDIDDPIFSSTIYGQNRNLDFLSAIEKAGLLASTAEHLHAMQRCQGVIVSTPRMAEAAAEAGMHKVFLWRNAIDAETEAAARNAISSVRTRNPERVVITYASGSRAHEADFREIERALVDVLGRHQNVYFHVIGYLEIPETLEPFRNRIEITPFSDYLAYMRSLANADIALVPLVRDDFNDCKSAIRYMEASLVGAACVVSEIGDFRHIIKDGRNGYLAGDQKAFESALERLVGDVELRKRLAANAREDVMATLTVEAVADDLDPQLRSLVHGH